MNRLVIGLALGAVAAAGALPAVGAVAQTPPTPPPPAMPAPPAKPPVAPPPGAAPTTLTPPAAPVIDLPPALTELDGRSIGAWLADFKNPDPSIRDAAVKVLPKFGAEAIRKEASKALTVLLDDNDPGIRSNVLLTLAASGYSSVEDARSATKKLIGILGRTFDGSVVRLHCVRAIGSIGTEAHEAIPALMKCTEDMAWETRQAVAMALGRVAGPHYEFDVVSDGVVAGKVPKLVRGPNDSAMRKLSFNMITDTASGVRIEACRALVYLGPPQPKDPSQYEELATPFLTKVTTRLNVERELSVKIWLHLIALMYDDRQTEVVLRQMRTLAGSPDQAVQVQALNALAVIGPKARAASAEISTALGSQNYYVVNAAINAMSGLGYEEIVSQVPNLKAALAGTANARIKERVKFVLDEVPKLKPPPGTPRTAVPPAPAGLP